MGFLDSLLGRQKIKTPAPDRLFALSTAYVQLQAAHDITTRGKAAIVFQPLGTADFAAVVTEMEEVVRGASQESGTTVSTHEDSFQYQWLIVADPDLEDQVVALNAVGEELRTGGYSDRVLCAVFAFADASGTPLYLIYNFKRGTWYPFVPAAGTQQRSTERELQLKAQIGDELPVEPELERWFPLWGIPV